MSPVAPRGAFFRSEFSLRVLAAGLAATLLLGGCHPVVKDPKDPKFIVAETKNWQLTRGELDAEINTFLKQRQKTVADVDPAKMPLLETQILNTVVVKKLILEKAATLPLKDVDKDDAATLAQVKSQVPNDAELEAKLKSAGMTMDSLKTEIHENTLARKTFEMEAAKNLDPSEVEVSNFYEQNKDKLQKMPDKIRASRVLVMADSKTSPAERTVKKKMIDKAHSRVAKGEDFSKVAREVSEDRYSAPKGGDVGFFQKGENEPGFDEVAFAAKQGAVSPVFQTATGYEFLMVTDTRAGGLPSLADERDPITRYLRQMKQREAMDSFAKKMIADGGVTFHLVRVDPSQIPGAMPANGAAPAPTPPPTPQESQAMPAPAATNAPGTRPE